MNLTTTRGRTTVRVSHQPARVGFTFEYGPDGDGPMLNFYVNGSDGILYGVMLNDRDIQAIMTARDEYKALFHGYDQKETERD